MPNRAPLIPRPARTRPEPPTDAAGLLTLGEARTLGWTDAAIRHAVASGRWRRVTAGVYAVAPEPAPAAPSRFAAERDRCLQRARATARSCPRATVSHCAAVVAHGLPTLGAPRPCLTVEAGTALRELSAAHLHRATLPVAEIVLIEGYPTTCAARTILDVARERGVDAGVVAADAALGRALLDRAELARALAGCAGWPGAKAARQTVESCDAGAESALESLSRLRIAGCGLPPPQLQAQIGDQFGRFVARCDFYWPEYGVVGECDGELKYETREALVAERRRERALIELGLLVVRWGWVDLRAFGAVDARLRDAFARGIRPGAGQRWGVLGPLHPGSSLWSAS